MNIMHQLFRYWVIQMMNVKLLAHGRPYLIDRLRKGEFNMESNILKIRALNCYI